MLGRSPEVLRCVLEVLCPTLNPTFAVAVEVWVIKVELLLAGDEPEDGGCGWHTGERSARASGQHAVNGHTRHEPEELDSAVLPAVNRRIKDLEAQRAGELIDARPVVASVDSDCEVARQVL